VGAADARPDVVDRGELRSARAAGSLDGRLERLPDSHPASPRYCADGHGAEDAGEWRDAGDADERVRPLTDAEHAEHVAEVRVRLEAAREAGEATHLRFTTDEHHEVWSYERRLIHDELVDDLFGAASSIPNEHVAIISGGLPGAGKTTVLAASAGIDTSRYLMINPDLIKEEMARRDLIPEITGLTPMEASELVHEESSHVARRLASRAQADGKNVIWDITMSRPGSAEGRVDSLQADGYKRIDGIFVDIAIETALRRVDARHRLGNEDYRNGVGLGGRLPPEEMILAQADEAWGSKNRGNFEQVKGQFTSWSVYDNSIDGVLAKLVATDHSDRDELKETRR
jgi:predicted kinase